MERFDHHCHVVGNCIGRGNQRSFTLYLLAMLSAQMLYLYLVPVVLMQQCTNTGGMCLHTIARAADFNGLVPASSAGTLPDGGSSSAAEQGIDLDAFGGSGVAGGGVSSRAWLLLSALWYGRLQRPGWLLLLMFHVSGGCKWR